MIVVRLSHGYFVCLCATGPWFLLEDGMAGSEGLVISASPLEAIICNNVAFAILDKAIYTVKSDSCCPFQTSVSGRCPD